MGSLSGTAKTNFFVTQGVLKWYLTGTHGAQVNFCGAHGVLEGYSRGTAGVLKGYSTGYSKVTLRRTRWRTRGVLTGYSRGTHGAQVNFFGTVRLCQALLPLLRASRGRVVNIGSIGARMPSAFGSAYADGTQHASPRGR